MVTEVNVTQIFAKRLKGLRESVGLSQGELGEKLGVSRGSISYYENESRVPDIVFLERVSEYFDVGINFLLGHSENQNPTNEDLGLYIDFSDKAIEKLLVDSKSYGSSLSALIENDHFEELFDTAEYFFLPIAFGNTPNFIDRGLFSDEFEYCVYQVSRIFTTMLLEQKTEVVDFFYNRFSNEFSDGDIQKKAFLDKMRDKELARVKELKKKSDAWLANERAMYEAQWATYVQNNQDELSDRKSRYEKTREYIASVSDVGKVDANNGND